MAKYLLPNGNLLQAVAVEGPFVGGGGAGGRFELWSWEGDLLWAYDYVNERQQAHHDIAVLPNGHFLFTAWEKYSEAEAKEKGRIYDGEVWSEKIVELQILPNNEAAIVWEWHLWDHLIQDVDPAKENYGSIADHPERININYLGATGATSGNWVHLNSIDYHPALDQIVVSARLLSELWIIDHSTSTSEAAASNGGRSGSGGDLLYRFGNPNTYDKGQARERDFFYQHDVKWIPVGHPQAGKLILFNNEYQSTLSRVEIWSPPLLADGTYLMGEDAVYGPTSPDWTFSEAGFFSSLMSSAQMLPNGNVLICEGMNGRFFEVNAEKEMLWEYLNPVNRNGAPVAQGGTVQFNQVFSITRYGLDYPAFHNREMEGRTPIEINPWENDCFSPNTLASSGTKVQLITNPVYQTLHLESFRAHPLKATLFDVLGTPLLELDLTFGFNQFDLPDLLPGIYLLDFLDHAGKLNSVKIVKL